VTGLVGFVLVPVGKTLKFGRD